MGFSFPKAPSLPKTTDQSKVSTAGGSGVAVDSVANGVASTAELEMYRKRREARIERGEDPDAVAKAQKARHESRKVAIKKLFGMKSESTKGDVTQDEGSGTKYYGPTSRPTDPDDGVIR